MPTNSVQEARISDHEDSRTLHLQRAHARAHHVVDVNVVGDRATIEEDESPGEELKAMTPRLGLSDAVRLMAWRSELGLIDHASDAVALTSRNEGSPVALIEAMAAGCAVVATDVDALYRELLCRAGVTP